METAAWNLFIIIIIPAVNYLLGIFAHGVDFMGVNWLYAPGMRALYKKQWQWPPVLHCGMPQTPPNSGPHF